MEEIRLIHTGDIHIGVQNYGRLDRNTGLHTRLLDFLGSLDKLVDYAVDREADAVLMAGDIFKNREPSVTQQREFAKRLKRLTDNNIAVYIITGNHDLHIAAGKAASVEIYDVLNLPGVYVRREPTVDTIKTRRGSFQVLAVPYSPIGNLDERDMDIAGSLDAVIGEIKTIIDELARELEAAIPTVMITHFSVEGAVPGIEASRMLGREITLPLAYLARREFDYVALGHIHKHQVLNKQPPVVYCGSIDRVDFNEEDDTKGFVEVLIKKGKARYKFVKLDTRPFKTIYIEALEGDPYTKIAGLVEQEELNEAIVKLRVKIPFSRLHSLRERELYSLLRRRAFYVAGIEKDVLMDTSRLRHPEITERMDVERAVVEYISREEGYSGLKDELLRANKRLINELREEESL